MMFEDWAAGKPRIVGYAAKWDEAAPEYSGTPRVFDWHRKEPDLRNALEKASDKTKLSITGSGHVVTRDAARHQVFEEALKFIQRLEQSN